MAKTVLLARPHPFIVSEMKPFLEQAGYEVTKLETLSDLALGAKNSQGVVISFAVSSSVGESAEDVFLQLRQSVPRVPVLFAALLPFEKYRSSLERVAKQAGIHATILGVDTQNENLSSLGSPETFLYISKDDLADATRRELALKLVQRHFR